MEQKIRLNLIPTGPMPVCYASQYDKKREIGLVLFNGTRPLLLTDETLELDVRKSDSHIVTIDVPTPEGTNLAVFETTEQMCAVAGSNECELRIKKAGSDIGSLNFIMEIERSPMENGLQSDSEIRNLATQIAEAATPVVQEIAPPIIRDFLADDYYTAEQTDEAIETATEGKADTTYVNTELDKKADKTDTYTKSQVDTIANRKMNSANPTGTGSIAVGSNMLNIGSNSQTFGSNTKALGNNAFATGENTQASVANQFVFGKYNQYSFGNLVEIVGNGTSESNRSNARTLDWNGNETLAGDLTFNRNKSLTSEISRLDSRITELPEPMVFKGTLGVNGDIQALPTPSASNEGWTFKCITAGTYSGLTLKVGDTVTCFNPPNTSVYEWDISGYGDTDTDTWRSIKVNGTEALGSGISSGSVDFEDTANVKFEFDADGNKISATLEGIYTDSEVDDLLDDKADADNTYTKEQVDDIVYNILPDDTASGSVANFETDLALPLKSLEVDVNAVQESGTPTPATPLPISGWSEINLYQLGGNFFNKNTVTNGKLINGSGNEVSYADWNISDFIPVVEGASYYLYGLTTHPNTNQDNFELFDENKNKVGYANVKTNEQPYVIPSGVAYIKCCVKNPDLDTAQLGVSVNASFVPYNPTLDKDVINLGGTYYGGHFTQDKDGHRQFEVTHIAFDDWANKNVKLYGINTYGIANFYLDHFSQVTKANVGICNLLTKQTSLYSDTTEEGFLINPSTQYIRLLSTRASTVDEFKTWATNNNLLIINELATPIIIDLPDGEPIETLVGTNNIFADTGDTSVVFKDSVNGYVEKKIASVQALALNT